MLLLVLQRGNSGLGKDEVQQKHLLQDGRAWIENRQRSMTDGGNRVGIVKNAENKVWSKV